MRLLFFVLCLSICFSSIRAQDHSLEYFLPDDVTYKPEIPEPSDIIGFVPGDWHVTHDNVVQYMTELARVSERITIENRGYTYERRPLILLTITSPENHAQLESIKEKRKTLTDAIKDNSDYETLPVVVNQGFSVHGNEPSGVNASLVLAYYLAAAEGESVDKLLNRSIILLDPSFNPDGIQRFAHWTNSNRSLHPNPDPNDREFDETWPGGRTNHYWFDLNRDWLPVQLPESQARIKTFYDWRPNVLTDHHEMGSNSTFFFQPGIPQRTNPLTPKINQELTGRIGEFHAKALDSIGSFYYSKESFDDFYYGKGSTFPDINGSIGILFEQASSRGSGQLTENGLLEFKFTVRNQFTTALSTIDAAIALRKDLLKLQDNFYHNTINDIEDTYYVIDNHKNPFLVKSLHEVLKKHQIETYAFTGEETIDGKKFNEETGFAIPLKQLQGRLAKAMFESRTTFKDSIFYDVSAWDFQHAFGVDFAETSKLNLANKIETYKLPLQDFSKSDYAYAIRWSDFNAPKLIYKLQDKGLRLKVAAKTFSTSTKEFDYGTVILPIQNQNLKAGQIFELLKSLNKDLKVEITALDTGLTTGINLGSPNVESINQPKIALLVGEGVRSYDAGEIWHLLDARLEIPVTKLDTKNFRISRLDKYTHLVIPSSSDRFLSKSDLEGLKSWVRKGGNIIGYRSTLRWLSRKGFINISFKSDSLNIKDISFEDRRKVRGARQIGGAIFEAHIDRSHPINFGFTNDKIALFRNTEFFMNPNKYSYNNPIQYTENPLVSGFINDSNLDLLRKTVPFQVNRFGRGRVMVFTDNTNFRGFWLGTTKLFLNGLFLSGLM
jgi:hypothetical protein